MMWPIFWPDDIKFDNPANTRHPSEDYDAAGKYIGDQIAAVVAALGTSEDPEGYGQSVARKLFPDVLPYVVGTPATYGFAGFNGRTLGRQRARSDAVARPQHRRPLGAEAGGGRGAAGRLLPLRRPGPTPRGRPRFVDHQTPPRARRSGSRSRGRAPVRSITRTRKRR